MGWLSLVAISDVFCGLFCHLFELTAPVEVFDEGLGAAPVLLDLDEEFEEDTRAEEGFDLFAGSGSDALQHLAALADEDGFLAGALAEDGGGDFGDGELAVLGLLQGGGLFEFFDDYGGGVGDFFSGEEEDLFADEFGDEKALGLVGELVFGEVALAFGEVGDDLVEEEVEALLFAGGDGDDVGEGVEVAPVGDEGEEAGFGDGVDLVEDEDDGAGELFHEREGEFVLGSGEGPAGGGMGIAFFTRRRQAVGGVDEEEDEVAGFEGVVDLLHHAAVELGGGLVDARGVDEDDLGGGVAGVGFSFFAEGEFEDSVDAGSRRLGFVGDDGELLAEQRVEQSGFAGVWPADDGDES